MTDTLAITQIVSVEAVESEQFEVRLLLEDTSEIVLRMDGLTLCSLADMASQRDPITIFSVREDCSTCRLHF